MVAAAVPPVASRSSTTSTRCARLHRIVVNLERVGAVLERVARALRFRRELAGLAHRREAGLQTIGDG